MKICYLANAASIHTVRWVKYFTDRGHEVHLISPGASGENAVENMNLHLLAMQTELSFKNTRWYDEVARELAE